MTSAVDVRAWSIWLIGALAVVFALDHPAVDLIVIVAAATVASAATARVFRTFLVFGLVIVLIRTALSALAGHTGEIVLFELPVAQLPAFLGGASLGGAVTAEVVLTALAEGARLMAVIACFGAFISMTESIDLIRLIPRFLFEAGLIVNIAMAFAPQLGRTAREVREAQLMRGERRRITPVVVPVVASALERATTLAESMDSRGYGRSTRPSGPSAEPHLVPIAVSASLAAASSAALWALGVSRPLTGSLTVALLLIIFGSLTQMSRNVPRVRYRRNRWERDEWLVAIVSAFTGAAAIGLSVLSSGRPAFNPYQTLLPPPPEVGSVLIATTLLIPAIIVETARRRST